ncbi:hypothetical protein OCU04_007990 [Sclerotinia nivalis]|uniref:Uncharacterized protein n=1 Tax=Sclerotinia nivalis TaxID=352851 RepID=A0A9X0AH67_9HELO|nr:hypothetical protein OCU04_007990 [Sclerotinia nivalis]
MTADRLQENPEPVDVTSKSQTVQNLLKDFVRKTAALTKEPGVFKVGFPYHSNPCRQGFPIMEVTTFEVSSNAQTQVKTLIVILNHITAITYNHCNPENIQFENIYKSLYH